MRSEVSFHGDGGAEFEAAFEWHYLRSEFVSSRFSDEMSAQLP